MIIIYHSKSLLIVVTILFLVVIGCSKEPGVTASLKFSQDDLIKLDKKMTELNSERHDLTQELAKYPSFSVSGKIIDKGSDTVGIFGSAVPSNSDWGQPCAVNEGNLVIRNARADNPSYYSNREVYFIDKSSGKNAFGAPVAVCVYTTTPPSTVDSIKKKIEKINAKYEEYRQSYLQLKENKFQSIKDNEVALFQYADESIKDNELQAAHRAFARIIEINPKNSDVHLKLGDLYSSGKDKDIEKAITSYQKAIEINPTHLEAHKKLGFLRYETNKDDAIVASGLLLFVKSAQPTDADLNKAMTILNQLGGRLSDSFKRSQKSIVELERLAATKRKYNKVADAESLEAQIKSTRETTSKEENIYKDIEAFLATKGLAIVATSVSEPPTTGAIPTKSYSGKFRNEEAWSSKMERMQSNIRGLEKNIESINRNKQSAIQRNDRRRAADFDSILIKYEKQLEEARTSFKEISEEGELSGYQKK